LVESLAQAGLSFLESSLGIKQCGRQTLARDGAIVQTSFPKQKVIDYRPNAASLPIQRSNNGGNANP